MKNDFDGSFDGLPDDGNSSEIHCGEAEWALFLARADADAERFCSFYANLEIADGEDRLDKCALAMGWQLAGDDADALPEAFSENSSEESSSPPPVYSLLNATEVVASRALAAFARERIRRILELNAANLKSFPTRKIFELAAVLSEAEMSMAFAVDAFSGREYGAAKLYMKRALAKLNAYFVLIAELEDASGTPAGKAVSEKSERSRRDFDELLRAVFDLRELCLRIIRDAREDEKSED